MPAEVGRRSQLVELAAIVASTDDAIIGGSPDGVITSWNPGAERMCGYSAAEAVGQPAAMLVPPDRVAQVRDQLGKLKRGERIDHYETTTRRKDGSLVDVSISIAPIRDLEGTVVGAATIL